MPKQVPAGQNAIDNQDYHKEMEFLHERLMGHQAFSRRRGQVDDFMDGLMKMIESSDSPTAFCQNWDQLSSDLRVLGNLMATLNRDGQLTAKNALEDALRFQGMTLPGETVPLESTTPITVVMVDPKRTLLMIRWILEAHWMDLGSYLEGKLRPDSERADLTVALFEAFPSLEAESRKCRENGLYEGNDLMASYRKDVLESDPSLKAILKDFCACEITFKQYNDHLELGRGFAYFIREDQKSVLSRFTREQQKRLATWQINLPTAMFESKGHSERGYRPLFCFYEECERKTFQPAYPSLNTLGVSHGLGIIAAPLVNQKRSESRYGEFLENFIAFHQGRRKEDKPYRFMLW